MAAFGLLSSSRAHGFAGPLSIPLSEIESYCRLYGVGGPEEVAGLIEMIQAMDAAYLEVAAKQAQADQKTAPRDPAKRRPVPHLRAGR